MILFKVVAFSAVVIANDKCVFSSKLFDFNPNSIGLSFCFHELSLNYRCKSHFWIHQGQQETCCARVTLLHILNFGKIYNCFNLHKSFSQMHIYIIKVRCCYWGSVLSPTKYLFIWVWQGMAISYLETSTLTLPFCIFKVPPHRAVGGMISFISSFSLFMLCRARKKTTNFKNLCVWSSWCCHINLTAPIRGDSHISVILMIF